MNQLGAAATWFGDRLLGPFASMPLTGLCFWSAVCGVGMTWFFGRTSSQEALQRTNDATRAQLLAIKLFKDDLAVTFQCQLQLLRATAVRLLLSVPPMLVMLGPFVLILVQLARWYEHAPLLPGEPAVVQLQLAADTWEQHRNVALEVPASLAVETESLRDEQNHTLYWRIRPEVAQPTVLRWRFGDRVVEKELAVALSGPRIVPVAIRRPGPGWFDRLLHPAEPGFDRGDLVLGIEIDHPRRCTPVLGIDLPWWATFFIVSMLTALVARRPLGVSM